LELLGLLRVEVEAIREGMEVLGAFTNSGVTGVLGVIREVLGVVKEVTLGARRCQK